MPTDENASFSLTRVLLKFTALNVYKRNRVLFLSLKNLIYKTATCLNLFVPVAICLDLFEPVSRLINLPKPV
jgi:hypothetical protein